MGQSRMMDQLSKREQVILSYLVRRFTNKEIAAELHLAVSSVKWYVRQIMNKLGVNNRREAVEQARALGWLTAEAPSDTLLQEQRTGPPHNIPYPVTSFIGRVDEIEIVCQLQNKHRLVTLTGSGGIGKTSLALQVARQRLESFSAGVWLVELASLNNPALVITAVAQALRLSEVPGVAVIDTLIAYLKNREMLLILDNCEHLLQACASTIEILLKGCPNLHILATSREFLNLPGEVTFRVPSLTMPDPSQLPPLAQLAQMDAVRLFVDRANQAGIGFILNDDNIQDVVNICHRLGGIPLAIELAAARVRVMPVDQITRRLDNVFNLLNGGTRTVLSRQQTLKATIDWSYDLLTEKERLLFHRLSVFAGGWTLEAAEEVCSGQGIDIDQVLNQLTSLLDKSLISTISSADGKNRFHMLETVRQYASAKLANDKLRDEGESQALRTQHLAYYLSLVEKLAPKIIGPEQIEILDELEIELDNLRLALEWALQYHVMAGLYLASNLEIFWNCRFHWIEGEQWLEKLLTKEAETRGSDLPQLDMPDILMWMKSYHALFSMITLLFPADPYRVRWSTLLPECIERCRQMGDVGSLELAKLNRLQAYILFWNGNIDESIVCLEESLTISQQKKFRMEEAITIHALGYYALLLGELAKSQTWLESGYILSKQLGRPDLLASYLGTLGLTVGFWEDQERGKELLEESLGILLKLSDLQEYHWTAVLLLHFCQDAQSIERAKIALFHFLETKNDNRSIWAYANLVYAEWSNGHFEEAGYWERESFSYVDSDPQLKTLNFRNYCFVFLWLARLAFSRGEIYEARVYLQTAAPWFRAAGQSLAFDYVHFLDFLAVLFAFSGEPVLAAKLFGAIEDMFDRYRVGLGSRQIMEHENAVEMVHESLTDEIFFATWDEGKVMAIPRAIRLASEHIA